MSSFIKGADVPMGLGMALMQNEPAMRYFAGLSVQQKQQVIHRTHSIESKEEMQAFVASLIR